MADKYIQEILNETKNLTKGLVSSETGVNSSAKKEKSGNVLKSLFRDFVYDSGEDETSSNVDVSTPEGLSAIGYPEIQEVELNENAGTKSFEEIYKDAGINSELSVFDLEAMLDSEDLKAQPTNLKQVAINFSLKQKGLTIETPLTDAATRDAALDAYSLALDNRASTGKQENDLRITSIEKELEDYFATKQEEIDSLKRDTLAKENEAESFFQKKKIEEQRMADIIKPFLGDKPNPITIGNKIESSTSVK